MPRGPQNSATQVAAERAGVGRVEDDGALGAGHRVDDEALLGAPPPVEGGLAGAGQLGDGVHREPVVADLEEQLDGRVEDLLLAVAFDAGALRA